MQTQQSAQVERIVAAKEIPTWSDQPLALYHGTTSTSAASILSSGIRLGYSRPRFDFGKGFYTTTSREQAESWAVQKAEVSQSEPMLLTFRVERIQIARLSCLCFVRFSPAAVDFWSFVQSCRFGKDTHWYDIVMGPVVKTYRKQLTVLEDSDQLSFHTETALSLLNGQSPEVVEL